MGKRIETVEDLVREFGGPTEMSKWTGTGQSGVSNWITRGYVPPGWHLRVLIEAGRRGWTISPAVFDLSEDDFAVLASSLTVWRKRKGGAEPLALGVE